MDIAKEITVINLGRAKEPSKPTWCVGPWELSLSWASPRLAFGLRSVDIRGCRPARFAMCFFDQSLPKGGGAKRPVQGLVTRSGGRLRGGSETPRMKICSCKQGSKVARLEAQVHQAWRS